MNDRYIEDLLARSVRPAPDSAWEKARQSIARKIASELIATLDGSMEPRKQESLDRADAVFISIFPKQFLKGV